MAKIEVCDDGKTWLFECPGCKLGHEIRDDRWQFNGNVDAPTIRPSILSNGSPRCHLFVTDGKIEFLTDSGHDLAGQTVDMLEID